MNDLRAQLQLAIAARERGDLAEALRLNQHLHDAPLPEVPEERSFRFFALFEWGLLAQEHAPARIALQVLRQREASQLDSNTEQRALFILEVNRCLGDNEATLKLFLHLESWAPALARRIFHHAADVLLACGAADVLQRHLPEPQEGTRYRAEYLNATENERSLPRRLGEALAFVSSVKLQCGLLALQGKAAEAQALQAMAVEMVTAQEARDLVLSELQEPGTIAALMAQWHVERDAQTVQGAQAGQAAGYQAAPSDRTQ